MSDENADDVYELMELQLRQLEDQLVEEMMKSQRLQAELDARDAATAANVAGDADGGDDDFLVVERSDVPDPARPSGADTSVDDGDVTTDHADKDLTTGALTTVRAMLSWGQHMFSAGPEVDVGLEDLPPFRVRQFRANMDRFLRASLPVRSAATWLSAVLRWESPALTLVVFQAVMMLVWHGWGLPGMLCLVWGMMARGWVLQIMDWDTPPLPPPPPAETQDRQAGKVKVLMDLARRAQQALLDAALILERLENLLCFRAGARSRRLFAMISGYLALSLVMSAATLLWMTVLVGAVYVFVVLAVLRRFPRLRTRLGKSSFADLPSHADVWGLEWTQPQSVQAEAPTMAGFGLPEHEPVLQSWTCLLMDKARRIRKSRRGRCLLTANHVCFETTGGNALGVGKAPREGAERFRFAHPLSALVDIRKSKTFSLLPGKGMSVTLLFRWDDGREEAVVLGQLLSRDPVIEAIVQQRAVVQRALQS